MTTKSRLIIVSNRLPLQLTERGGKVFLRESDGGLVSALKSYFDGATGHETFSERIWVGAADFPASRWEKYKAGNQVKTAYSIEPVFIPEETYDSYYNSFCNAILWPLFHYFSNYVAFSDNSFSCYEKVNKQFGEKILSILQPGDTVWVHDYQLMLLPGMLRKEQPDLTLGFFLHIPFPAYEIFRLMHHTWKKKIIDGLLGADLIGFHTHDYVQHFLDAVHHTKGITHQFRSVRLQDRIVQTGVFALGIDYEKFFNQHDSADVIVEKQGIRDKFKNQKIIFSVDRLDYTKGITHRLAGFQRFLELFPEWHEKVVFILVVVPSRQIVSKYNERRKLIEELISRINGRYSTLQWQPILYRYKNLKFSELSMQYQIADVALITPLRDGMNLVAKEFAASRKHQDGVLILSELAGAAHEMGEAILVNPTDKEEVAHAIFEGLGMDIETQRIRMGLMQERLKKYNVTRWVNCFLESLEKTKAGSNGTQAIPICLSDMTQLKKDFHQSRKRLILIDYDGTLVPFHVDPQEAKPSDVLLEWLRSASKDNRNQLVIISGRKLETLEEWFQGINIHLVGEHGIRMKLAGQEKVSEPASLLSEAKQIRSTLEMFADRCPGSFVEEKENSLAWHYRAVDPDMGFKQSRDLIECLFHLLRNSKMTLIDGKKVIEVRPATVHKGTAAKKVIHLLDPDFTIVIGDDATDEDMFEVLKSEAITIKVGEGESRASYRLPGQESVFTFIQKLVALEDE